MQPKPGTDDAASRIIVSGHQVDVGDTLRAHATEQLEALGQKYFDKAEDATCTFSRTGNGGFACSVRVHSGRGLYFDGEGEHAAAPGAFAVALERVAKQLRRRKRELREDKPVNPTRDGVLQPTSHPATCKDMQQVAGFVSAANVALDHSRFADDWPCRMVFEDAGAPWAPIAGMAEARGSVTVPA